MSEPARRNPGGRNILLPPTNELCRNARQFGRGLRRLQRRHHCHQYHEMLILQSQGPWPDTCAAHGRPALVVHFVMARVAVVQRQFGIRSCIGVDSLPHQFDESTCRLNLACKPQVESRDFAFPLPIVVIHIVVSGLVRRKCFKFEHQPGMTGAHDVMTRKFVRRAHVARQTNHCPFLGRLCWVHTGRQVVGMCCTLCCMALDPFFGASMAGLTADSIPDLKFRPAFFNRHIICVAIETDFRRGRAGQAQVIGHFPGLLVLQNSVGLGVLVGAGPHTIFVQPDIAPVLSVEFSMTYTARAAGNPKVHFIGDLIFVRVSATRNHQHRH